MRRVPWLSALFLVLLALVLGTPAAAQDGDEHFDGRVLVSVNGDMTLPAGDEAEVLVVVDGDALIEGTARVVTVVNGTATLAGGTVGTLAIVNGDAQDRPGEHRHGGRRGAPEHGGRGPHRDRRRRCAIDDDGPRRHRNRDRGAGPAGLDRVHDRRLGGGPRARGVRRPAGPQRGMAHLEGTHPHVRCGPCAALPAAHHRRAADRHGGAAARGARADAVRVARAHVPRLAGGVDLDRGLDICGPRAAQHRSADPTWA